MMKRTQQSAPAFFERLKKVEKSMPKEMTVREKSCRRRKKTMARLRVSNRRMASMRKAVRKLKTEKSSM